MKRAAMKRYKVTLDAEERQHLHDLIAAGKSAARKLTHARILLKADAAEGGLAWPDSQIADAPEVSTPGGQARRSSLARRTETREELEWEVAAWGEGQGEGSSISIEFKPPIRCAAVL